MWSNKMKEKVGMKKKKESGFNESVKPIGCFYKLLFVSLSENSGK